MTKEEYKALPKIRRLAVFFLVIGPEQAAPIVKSFAAKQHEAIIREMSEIEVIDDALQQMVLQEFSGFLAESLSSLRGGKEAAVTFFENVLGVEGAEKVSAQIGPPKVLEEISGRFEGMKAAQIWMALSEEDSQVLAYVLSTINARKTAEILAMMESAKAADVFIRMSQMETTTANLLPRVAKNVLRAVPQEVAQNRVKLGGAARSAEVLKVFKRERSQELLAAIDEVDENLGKAISKEMFSFKDLANIPPEAMQRIMREVDSSLLVVAMNTAAPDLLEKIYGSLSKRGAEALKEELAMQGKVPAAEVEVAQDAVLDVVRKLESEGEVVLSVEEVDYV
jgi:flagellar motor switch protein FliG